MFGPGWDKPCYSCTSLMDGFDRAWYSVSRDAAFAGIAKAPPEKINAWAKERGWSQDGKISLFWSSESAGIDTVWPYWNLMDFTPEGRPERLTPLHRFRSEFFERNYLNKH